MSLAQDMELLAGVRLFDGFPEEQLRMLSFGATHKYYRCGETIFRQGDLSNGGFIVADGQVDIFIERDGREVILSSQLKNSLIGEMALITQNRRAASALARSNVDLLHIPRDLFKRMLEEYPDLAQTLHQRITRSMQELIDKMTPVQDRLSEISDLTLSESDEAPVVRSLLKN